MKLLFRHSQTSGIIVKVKFKLWAKVEFESDEAEIIKKYRLDDTILILMPQPGLIRNSLIAAVVASAVAYVVLIPFGLQGSILPFMVGVIFGFFYYHQRRETILMKDLIHGRYFKCNSVIDQAKREKWLTDTVAILRQVMEAAKHWDGTETLSVPLLKKEAARKLIAEL